METDVFRIVQECLTNIHRHSGNGELRFGFPGLTPTFALKWRTRARGYHQRKQLEREQAGKAESEVCEKESVNWEVAWKSVLSASAEE